MLKFNRKQSKGLFRCDGLCLLKYENILLEKNRPNTIITHCLFIQQMITPDLPIKQCKRHFLYALDTHNIVILTAETGSGKTTQLPKYLIEAGYTLNNKKIAVSVPRRIAAFSIARRISQELGVYNGEIAHHVRFNSMIGENTKVVLMTDGMMVQQLYSDPLLEQYSVIMLDDIHEKSINCEILFGFLKKIIVRREKTNNKLKLVITSATLETQKLESFFSIKSNYRDELALSVKTINVMGRLHDVKISYLRQPTSNYFLKIFQTIIYIDRETAEGNILVFLTSVQEIQGMYNMLDSFAEENKKRFSVMPLHSGLSLEKQSQIFEFSRDRKIILSTNIAESSITIPDIKYVIDCGYVKIKAYDPEKGIQRMIVVPCGKSSAIQRAGRAGRVFDGECFRIYTENAYRKMPEKVLPELLRVDFSAFLLKLLGLGIKDIVDFQMIDKPPESHFTRAIDNLLAYELVDENFSLTLKGQKVAQLSLDIRSACMLLNSFDARFGCSQQIIMLVSLLQVQRDLFTNNSLALLKAKKKIGAKEGDFITLINMFLRYSRAKGEKDKRKVCSELKLSYQTMQHALKIHQQLIEQVKKFRRTKTQQQLMIIKYSDPPNTNTNVNNSLQKYNNFQLKSSSDEYQAILRCILSGYFTNIAQIQSDSTYLNIRSKQKLQLHPTSILSTVYPEWIVYHEIIKSSQYFIHNASVIEFDWIFQLAGHYYKDMRKEQAENRYGSQKQKKVEDYQPKIEPQAQDKIQLVQVGGKKAKPQIFKTSVLGLKGIKKNKLSFQQDYDI